MVAGRSVREKAASLALGGLLLGLAGCAATPPVTEIVWPPPPLTPRIQFVGQLRNADDLGRGAMDLLTEALVGRTVPESLGQPMGVATSRDGTRLYVTDYAKSAVFVFDLAAGRMSPFGDAKRGFQTPLGIAVDDSDNVYVVEPEKRAVSVLDASGRFLRQITHESIERPTGIAIDPSRRCLYLADTSSRTSENHMIRVFDMDGNYLKAFGGKGSDEGQLYFPTYLALDEAGNLYVTDTMNARVQVFDPDGVYLKTFGERGDRFGMFDKPKGVALDSFGNVYVVDSAWSNVQIFNQRGQVLLFFGSRGRFPGLLFNPTGITIDGSNRIYVADAFNARIGIYQLVNTTAEDSFLEIPNASTDEEGGSDPG